MDIQEAQNLIHGLIGEDGAELIINDDGSACIDVSCVKDGVIQLDTESITSLLADLAVALWIAKNA